MSTWSMHKIKSQARKEAWYGESTGFNPFRKNLRGPAKVGSMRGSQSWAPGGPPDLEGGIPEEESTMGPKRHTNLTEPVIGSSSFNPNEAPRSSKEGEVEMTSGKGVAQRSEDSQVTAVPTRSSKPPSLEVRARRNFVNKFFKHEKDDGEDNVGEGAAQEKKAPWYKGKPLKHEPFTLRNQLQATIFNSWVNLLLIAAPVGIALNYAKVNGTVIFVVNFIAIIPLAGMLSFATEEISLHVGESLGGLLNASFGNAVEMIVAIIALAKGEVVVVQTSLIGSILSNLLLVMGMCFFFGGLRRTEQFFNVTVAQTAASLLALAVGSVIIPTCFDKFSDTPQADVAALSRGTAIILLVVYIGYLFFQLKTHSAMFAEESQKVAMRPRKHALPQGAISKGLAKAGGIGISTGRPQYEQSQQPSQDQILKTTAYEDEDDEPEMPQLHIAVAWATLAGATAIIGLCAEFMVDGISAITASGAVSIEFVGLILLPIVGNAAEHATAVTVALRDKLDLALSITTGSSLQVAFLLLPLMVVIGWGLGNDDMTLSFDGFQVVVLFVAVFGVNSLVADGKSNWLEGMILICLYAIIALCAFEYPAP